MDDPTWKGILNEMFQRELFWGCCGIFIIHSFMSNVFKESIINIFLDNFERNWKFRNQIAIIHFCYLKILQCTFSWNVFQKTIFVWKSVWNKIQKWKFCFYCLHPFSSFHLFIHPLLGLDCQMVCQRFWIVWLMVHNVIACDANLFRLSRY